MKKIIFKGCGTAIITPFTEDGVNFDEFAKLIEFQIKEGADSIIVCGTTRRIFYYDFRRKERNYKICC